MPPYISTQDNYNFEQNLAAKIKTDDKLFWSYVRSKQKTKTVLQQLQTENGEFSNDSAENANLSFCLGKGSARGI